MQKTGDTRLRTLDGLRATPGRGIQKTGEKQRESWNVGRMFKK